MRSRRAFWALLLLGVKFANLKFLKEPKSAFFAFYWLLWMWKSFPQTKISCNTQKTAGKAEKIVFLASFFRWFPHQQGRVENKKKGKKGSHPKTSTILNKM
jgi:hypothetical protein